MLLSLSFSSFFCLYLIILTQRIYFLLNYGSVDIWVLDFDFLKGKNDVGKEEEVAERHIRTNMTRIINIIM